MDWDGIGVSWAGICPRGVPGWASPRALPGVPYLGGGRADVSQQLVDVPVVLEAPKNQGNWDLGTFWGHWGAGMGTGRCHPPAPQLQRILETSLIHGRGDVLGLGAQRGISVGSGCPGWDWGVLGRIGVGWGRICPLGGIGVSWYGIHPWAGSGATPGLPPSLLTTCTHSMRGRRTAWLPDRLTTQAGVSGVPSSSAITASTPILLP